VDAPLPIAAAALLWTMAAGSTLTLLWLFQRHVGGQPLLDFEPRRPVPWNFLAPTVVLAPAIMAMAAARAEVETSAASTQSEALTASDLWAYAGTTLVLTSIYLAAMIAIFRAGAADLGLPQSWCQFRRDVLIGVVAFLASLAPVYAVQFVMTTVFTPEHMHPLIEDLQENFTPALIVAAVATAVVAAPVHEEIVFRLILQGWLERKLLKNSTRTAAAPGGDDATSPLAAGAGDASFVAGEDVGGGPTFDAAPEASAGDVELTRLRRWAPVVISAILFALAHLGHGVAPFSLFPLGLALGYVYQRTHRIVPSIVCHMLFNGLTINVLWLTLSGQQAAGP
jgi:membrane protease YdiL (CAAX protease family)